MTNERFYQAYSLFSVKHEMTRAEFAAAFTVGDDGIVRGVYGGDHIVVINPVKRTVTVSDYPDGEVHL